MKNYIPLVILILLVSCTNSGSVEGNLNVADSTSLEAMSVEETEVPTLTPALEPNEQTAAESIDVETEIAPPPPPPPPAKAAIKSEFKEEACCAEIIALQACCCEKLIGRLKDHLKADNLEAAGNLAGTDEYYKPCVNQFTDFESQFNKVIDDFFSDSE